MKALIAAFCEIFEEKVSPELLIRRLTLSVDDMTDENAALAECCFEQLDMFSAPPDEDAAENDNAQNEKELQRVMLAIKEKYGKNAVFRALSLCDGATGLARNEQTGGHKN